MSSIEAGSAPVAAGPPPGLRRRRRYLRSLAVALVSLLLFAGIATVGWQWLHSPAAGIVPCPSGSPKGRAPKAVVRVLNGTVHRGLARDTAALLSDRGFSIAGVGNAPRVKGATQVRYGAGQNGSARLVALQVPTSVLVADGRVKNRVDLVLGGTFSRLRTTAEVNAAKKKVKLPKVAVPVVSPSCT